MNHYESFRKTNKIVKSDNIKVTITSVNYDKNLCIVQGGDRRYFLLPIELLIADMLNEMCHINDFTKLRNWKGFEDENAWQRMKEAYYPKDYFDNETKYVVDVTDILTTKGSNEVYKTIGQDVFSNYYNNFSS